MISTTTSSSITTTTTTAMTTTTTTTVTTTTTTTSTTSVTTTTSTTTKTTTTTTATTSCISPCICAGVASYTQWQAYSTDGMTMTISTSGCNFVQTPQYYTSIGGTSNHWSLSGYDSIYSPSSTSFTIYSMNMAGWSSSTMVSYANSYSWNVYWVGIYD
ncbi:unnamed protein product [Rotaria socialis]|uniref:Uncharacterized protein n=1 Tax=Rotaria socialis TaxID=392032 RepID=A0A818HIN5_9BILA|nr:unnamed protein product [Rotaria socialis]CAF4835821.1 unnamed protein product [Rotaria socialis]